MISDSTLGVDDVLDQRQPHTYQDLSSLYAQAKQKVKSQ
jgi:chromosome segregation ATPase